MITIIGKAAYEEIYRYHDFANWLGESETIESHSVSIVDKVTGENKTSTMISSTAVAESTKIRYLLIGGTADTYYTIIFRVTTSLGQKFESEIDLLIT